MNDEKMASIICDIFDIGDSVSIGILISWLSYNYLKSFKITEEEFFTSLKNSIEIIDKKEEK